MIGPWRHSGANYYGYELGALTFNGDTALQWRQQYMKPFFDHWLKGAPDPHTPPVLTYATGINKWEVSDHWPMGTPTPLYLGAGHGARFAASAARAATTTSRTRPIRCRSCRVRSTWRQRQWHTWLVPDQRFVAAGPTCSNIKARRSTSRCTSWARPGPTSSSPPAAPTPTVVVKLIDVYPNDMPEGAAQGGKPAMAGFELPIGIDIFRGRYVKERRIPRALAPGKVDRFRFNLPNVDHVFLPGHRIAVQVQSSLFPLYDRNPQTFVPNIFNAKAGDYRKAEISVAYGGAQPQRGVVAGRSLAKAISRWWSAAGEELAPGTG